MGASFCISVPRLYSRVAPPDDVSSYGLHGIRVEAYNRARVHDPLLAVAQGGWASTAHTRYARFSVLEVLALPRAMISVGHDPLSASSLSLVEAPSELQVARLAGPRLGRARGALVAATPSPSRRAVPTTPTAPPRARRSKPKKSRVTAIPISTALTLPSPPSSSSFSGRVDPPLPPPPPVVRSSSRGGSRAAAFAGSYFH